MTTSTNMTQFLSPNPKSGSEKYQTKKEVQVDLSNVMGRIKPKPVCVDATLKQQSMSCEEISKHIFTVDEPNSMANKGPLYAGSNDLSVVSSSSSTASRENVLSDSTTDGSKSNLSDEEIRIVNLAQHNIRNHISGHPPHRRVRREPCKCRHGSACAPKQGEFTDGHDRPSS